MADMTINGYDISDSGGASLLDYSIGSPESDLIYFLGIERTSPLFINKYFGMRPMTVTIIFTASTLHDAKVNRSYLNSRMAGKFELYIPDDGFYYTCMCQDYGQEELVGIGDSTAQIKSTYKLIGIRHGELITVNAVPVNGWFSYQPSLAAPYADCRITATVESAATTFYMQTGYFSNVSAGDVLVFDGLTGIISKNGATSNLNVSFNRFPFLLKGINQIHLSGPAEIAYYPIFI